jgi:hypothetical protein
MTPFKSVYMFFIIVSFRDEINKDNTNTDGRIIDDTERERERDRQTDRLEI